MLVFFENGKGGVCALLTLRKCPSGETPMDGPQIKEVTLAISDITGIPFEQITVSGFPGVRRRAAGVIDYWPRYDEIAAAIKERGLYAIRSRVIIRKDEDLLAQNEPLSQSGAAFYVGRKPWKYSKVFLLNPKLDGRSGYNLRRCGTGNRHFKLAPTKRTDQ